MSLLLDFVLFLCVVIAVLTLWKDKCYIEDLEDEVFMLMTRINELERERFNRQDEAKQVPLAPVTDDTNRY